MYIVKNGIEMVNLKKQYQRLKKDIDSSIFRVIESSKFIKGDEFESFQIELANYLQVQNVIGCGNGTDALQIALMALNLKKGDEVIVPSFTYVATAEVIGLLGLKPVFVNVDSSTFNLNKEIIEDAITLKTKLIVPVHLFGQCSEMEGILEAVGNKDIIIIEDTAQSIGAEYTFTNGKTFKAGTIGAIGTTSFFPSKNLGCFGDGGAIFTNHSIFAEKIKMISNHGQSKQYVHDIIGINSRLDNLQASILRVKLRQINDFILRRNEVANFYNNNLISNKYIETPVKTPKSTHVYNQYTLKIKGGLRNDLKKYLESKKIPSMIYYPIPLHLQKAFKDIGRKSGDLSISEQLCTEVLSLPIHTEMTSSELQYIVEHVNIFFNGK